MEQIVLQPTTTAHWHALVAEAQTKCTITLNEELESYLVFLLMRFTEQTDFSGSVLALDFLQGVQLGGHERQEQLREVGDKCLLYSGLFPGRVERKRLRLSYFVDLGQSAYGLLSTIEAAKLAALFAELTQGFVPLMDVLLAMRKMTGDKAALLPLQAQELWQETGSQQAYDSLQSQADDAIIVKHCIDSSAKHH